MYYKDFIQKIEKAGIGLADARTFDVLILPENIGSFEKVEELFEALGAADLIKRLQEAGCKCASAFNFGVDVPALERRGSDRWLGCIWIRDMVAIPLVIGTLGSLLAMKIAESPDRGQPPPSHPIVHARIVIGDVDGGFSFIDYDGDGKTLIKVLEGLKDVRKIAHAAE
jgi:hypothetical protein